MLERTPELNSTPGHAGERTGAPRRVLAWERHIVKSPQPCREHTEEGTAQVQEGQVEIAKEPLIGGQITSKNRPLGFHPQKARELRVTMG